MLAKESIHQTGLNGQHTPQTDNQITTDLIAKYTGELSLEVQKLEEELQQKRAILGLYQSWLNQRVSEGAE